MLIVFSHIPKTAGITISHILRQNFGLRYINLISRVADGCDLTIDDLYLGFKFCRNLSAVSSHFFTPRSGLETCQQDVFRFVFLRDPVRRYVSHYQYRMEVMVPRGLEEPYSFDEWLRKEWARNLQTRHIAGKEDLLAAKRALLHKFDFVGIVERFDESLLLLQNRLKKYDIDFRIEYRKKNVAKSNKIATEILEERWDEYQQRIIDNNSSYPTQIR